MLRTMLGLWLSTKLIFGSQLLQIVVVREKRLVENESKNCLVVALLVHLSKIKSKYLLDRILHFNFNEMSLFSKCESKYSPS